MGTSSPEPWQPTREDLLRAIEHAEFGVRYQPIVDLQTSHMAGAEALIYWQHPERGRLSAGKFLGMAEALGLNVTISEWVQRTVCRQTRSWLDAGYDLPVVSLNLATAQLRPGYLAAFVRSLLAEEALEPHRIAVEIHGAQLEDGTAARTVLAELATVGVPLWSDDFGKGQMTMLYLAQYPYTVLKLDLKYVWAMEGSPRVAQLVAGVIDLAHRLEMRVVAEGVINGAQNALLREFGCDLVQGGYFSLPVPPEGITTILAAGGAVPEQPDYVD